MPSNLVADLNLVSGWRNSICKSATHQDMTKMNICYTDDHPSRYRVIRYTTYLPQKWIWSSRKIREKMPRYFFFLEMKHEGRLETTHVLSTFLIANLLLWNWWSHASFLSGRCAKRTWPWGGVWWTRRLVNIQIVQIFKYCSSSGGKKSRVSSSTGNFYCFLLKDWNP